MASVLSLCVNVHVNVTLMTIIRLGMAFERRKLTCSQYLQINTILLVLGLALLVL